MLVNASVASYPKIPYNYSQLFADKGFDNADSSVNIGL